jgi:hypothetical protein
MRILKPLIIVLLFMLIFQPDILSQEVIQPPANAGDNTTFSNVQMLDTSITPDYFLVEISITEFYRYYGKRRNSFSTKVVIDTAKELLLFELRKLGITNSRLIKIAEPSEYHYGNSPLQATYEFMVNSIDSLENICRLLTAALPQCLSKVKGVPMVTEQRLERIKADLETRALNKAKIAAEKFGAANSLKVQKIAFYQATLNKKSEFYGYSINDAARFSIDYDKPVYTLYGNYSFYLK